MVPATSRNITIDVIRGIAILLVVIHHIVFPPVISSQTLTGVLLGFLKTILSFISHGGWSGVDLFFVLSGFLVSGLLFKEYNQTQQVNIGRFLIRRGFKIYPIFYTFLIFTLGLEIVSHQIKHSAAPLNLTNYIYDFTFTGNYQIGHWSHLWSLDIEEHFYLLLAIYFYLLIKYKKLNHKTILITLITLLTATLLMRAYHVVYITGSVFIDNFAQTHIRIDALFCGVFIAYIYHYLPEKIDRIYKYRILLSIVAIAYLLTNFIFDEYGCKWIRVVSLGINPVCYGVLLIILLKADMQWFKSKTLAWIGRISYAMYVWHYFINFFLKYHYQTIKTVPTHWLYYLLVYFTLSILTGWLVTKYLESPLLKVRDRFFPATSTKNGEKTRFDNPSLTG